MYVLHNTFRSLLCRLVVLGWGCGCGSRRRPSVAEGLHLGPLDNVGAGTTTTRFKRSCFSSLTLGHKAAMRRCQIVQARRPNQTLKFTHQSHVIYERDYGVFQYVGVNQGQVFPVFRRIARCRSAGRYRSGRRRWHVSCSRCNGRTRRQRRSGRWSRQDSRGWRWGRGWRGCGRNCDGARAGRGSRWSG